MTTKADLSATRGAWDVRLHILSDLHLETGSRQLDGYALPDCDVVIAAGDIHADVNQAVAWLAALGKPVVYVLGNHELWGSADPSSVPPLPDFADTIARARAIARGTDVHVLENDAVVIDGIRFLGTTLWADFGGGRLYAAARSMRGGWRLRNYACIGAEQFYRDPANAKTVAAIRAEDPESVEREALHPRIAHLLHQQALDFLSESLHEPFDGPTVVVSHMAPHYDSLTRSGLDSRFLTLAAWVEPEREAPLHRVAEYASDLSRTLRWSASRIDLWVHGHVHAALDYAVEGVRVVCNPAGYHHAPVVGFTPSKVVALKEGLAACLRRDVEPVIEDLREIQDEAREVARALSEASSVTQRCVQRVFHERCERFTNLASGTFARMSRQMGDSWSGGGWNFPQLLTGETVPLPFPRLPLVGPGSFDTAARPSVKGEGGEVLAQMARAIEVLSEYPEAVGRLQLKVQVRVAAIVEALEEAGGRVTITGPVARPRWRCAPHGSHAIIFVQGISTTQRDEWVQRADRIANPEGVPRQVLVEMYFRAPPEL
ncbi:metallophosphoesterase [Azoarcus sp. KH32C]|uniref:metallophosphoesterase n=1 Tax=Azoarcus sp. KH32C TaxID=748247 RepID=UPI000238681B|nr:metallophosphoesterase [Azoarcus sp. KH32C]BAL23734.1 hypothetical protein AZKH_1412 [Azoarcus sp. KH32C]